MTYILGNSRLPKKGLRFLDTYNQMSDVMKTNNNNNQL